MKPAAKAQPVVQNINSRIAANVRTLRSGRDITLDALAAKSNVSRSMISLIERGQISPTAVILEKVAAGLGVPLASLFDDSTALPDPVSRHDDRTPWQDPQSGYVRTNISPANFPSPIHLVEVLFPAGAKVGYEAVPGDVDIYQQIWVQDGSLEITVGTTAHRLSEGDCLAMQRNEPAIFHNRTRKSTRYIVAITTEHSRSTRK